MGDDYENRLNQIVQKLSQPSPSKSRPNSTTNTYNRLLGVKKLSGIHKRKDLRSGNVQELGKTLANRATSSSRPWDREDLFRRMSTFKSMTWFAKPQAVSPLNCARRGWVNVDMDTIACESCGARIFFSTPSAWSQQQVEKAALVFSLKLESGHKRLCPWINNSCTEELAKFPAVPRANLVEDYKNRLFTISQLTALPIISTVAIDNMKSSELEHFLKDILTSDYSAHVKSCTMATGDVPESVSSYYKAQKLISLCGWDPHILPYIVDLKDEQKKYIQGTNIRFSDGQKQKVDVQTLCTEGNKDSCQLHLDPSSIVLDCKLCGASVGLWTFATVPRPTEYLRFVGLTKVDGKASSSLTGVSELQISPGNEINTGTTEGTRSTVNTASTPRGFSIAGGPPPDMVNYGAAITLPVVGQSLRARFMAVQTLSQADDQLRSPQNATITCDAAFETSSTDLIAKCPSQVFPTVPEGSYLVDSPNVGEHGLDAGEFSCSTSEHQTDRNGGREGPNMDDIIEVDNDERGAIILPGEDKKQPLFSELREFDPIKQHRPFCPWILASAKFTPGWRQTLTALQGLRESNFLHGMPSSSLMEVDDPVTSVRMLFESPPYKRTKLSGGS